MEYFYKKFHFEFELNLPCNLKLGNNFNFHSIQTRWNLYAQITLSKFTYIYISANMQIRDMGRFYNFSIQIFMNWTLHFHLFGTSLFIKIFDNLTFKFISATDTVMQDKYVHMLQRVDWYKKNYDYFIRWLLTNDICQ